jgi:hypothetical protein
MSASHDDLSGFGALGPAGGGGGNTLILTHGTNLAIDLIWDPSVASAPVGFTAAVDAAAKLLVSVLNPASPTIDYVTVGWGEVGGTLLAPDSGILGKNNANMVMDFASSDYQAVVNALAAHGDDVSTAQADGSVLAQFPVDFTTAEGKALGLLPESYNADHGVADGSIGFNTLAGTGNSWQFEATGTRPTQYNLQTVAVHELSEVLGRLSSQGLLGGTVGGQALPALMPLDLLTFSAPGALALNAGGYFSTDNGVTHMGQFNPYYLYGDIGDWASFPTVSASQTLPRSHQDAFDAFLQPGYNLAFSPADLLVMKALGY